MFSFNKISPELSDKHHKIEYFDLIWGNGEAGSKIAIAGRRYYNGFIVGSNYGEDVPSQLYDYYVGLGTTGLARDITISKQRIEQDYNVKLVKSYEVCINEYKKLLDKKKLRILWVACGGGASGTALISTGPRIAHELGCENYVLFGITENLKQFPEGPNALVGLSDLLNLVDPVEPSKGIVQSIILFDNKFVKDTYGIGRADAWENVNLALHHYYHEFSKLYKLHDSVQAFNVIDQSECERICLSKGGFFDLREINFDSEQTIKNILGCLEEPIQEDSNVNPRYFDYKSIDFDSTTQFPAGDTLVRLKEKSVSGKEFIRNLMRTLLQTPEFSVFCTWHKFSDARLHSIVLCIHSDFMAKNKSFKFMEFASILFEEANKLGTSKFSFPRTCISKDFNSALQIKVVLSGLSKSEFLGKLHKTVQSSFKDMKGKSSGTPSLQFGLQNIELSE